MIKLSDIKQVYTGRQGCACGCRGTYHIASSFGVLQANEQSGWEAHEKCNDRAVKMAVNKINKLIDWNDPEDVKEHVRPNDDKGRGHSFAYYDFGNDRTVTVYFFEDTDKKVST
jgi:hypothetical protein